MSFERQQIGEHVLYCGDCLEILPTLKGLDSVITDPPYGIGIEYGEKYIDDFDSWLKLMRAAIERAKAVSPVVACFMGITNLHSMPKPDWISAHVWRTTGCFGKCGVNQWMPILIYGKDVEGFGSVNGVIKSDVLQFDGGEGVGFLRDKAADLHPCPKPTNVMLRCVKRFSMAKDTVCDPFMGSGTTGVACVQTGRRFIGIEIERKYFDIACKRIEDAEGIGTLFDPKQTERASLFAGAT